jgi:hypothetical protein
VSWRWKYHDGVVSSEDGIVLVSGELEIIYRMATMVLLASLRFAPFAASEALKELGSTVDTRRRSPADSMECSSRQFIGLEGPISMLCMVVDSCGAGQIGPLGVVSTCC